MAVRKSVEYVEVSITASTEPVTVNLTKGQDETQCTPWYTVRVTGTTGNQWQDITGLVEIIDNAGTAAVRVTSSAMVETSAVIFHVFVIEWEVSINVQQIDVSALTDGTASTNVSITDVTAQADAFMWYSYQFTAPPASDDDFSDAMIQCRFNGASTTSITLSRRATGGTCNGVLYVVDCDSSEWIVDHREIDFATSTNTSDTDTISATVLVDTFLIHSYETDHGQDHTLTGLWAADLQNTTTVRIRRSVGATPLANASTHSIAVVECQNNEWDVQRNDAFAITGTSQTDTITAVDLARSVILSLTQPASPSSTGRSDTTSGNAVPGFQTSLDLSSTTTVRGRMFDTVTTDSLISYEVIQFALASSSAQRLSQLGIYGMNVMSGGFK